MSHDTDLRIHLAAGRLHRAAVRGNTATVRSEALALVALTEPEDHPGIRCGACGCVVAEMGQFEEHAEAAHGGMAGLRVLDGGRG